MIWKKLSKLNQGEKMKWNLIKKIITGLSFLIMLYLFVTKLMTSWKLLSSQTANMGYPAELYFTLIKLAWVISIAIVGLTLLYILNRWL